MKLLLDTCTFLWATVADPSLSKVATRLLEDPENELHLSAVSSWEISVQHAAGKLPLPEVPELFVPKARGLLDIRSLALSEEAVLTHSKLPWMHRDPFDRMLVGQAISEGMPILTPDPWISRYPVRTVW